MASPNAQIMQYPTDSVKYIYEYSNPVDGNYETRLRR
ncbi:MAG: hypothetical protein ACI82A_004159, partial [Candidatus Azotimanducaceae bacterium]